LMYNRVSVYVPPGSEIHTMGDLKGKTLALPFGAAVQREAIRGITAAGLNPADVKLINLDLSEQAALIATEKDGTWGDIDALGGFDPTPAIFEAKGLIRYVQTSNVVAVVVMRKSALEKPGLAAGFLTALAESWLFFARNSERVNEWYKADANFTFDGQKPLEISAGVEPNSAATVIGDVRLTFSDTDLAVVQEAADFLFKNGLIEKPIRMADSIDTSVVAGLRISESAASLVRAP